MTTFNPAEIADAQLFAGQCQLRGLLHWAERWSEESELFWTQPSLPQAERMMWYRDAIYSHADAMFNSSSQGKGPVRGAVRRALLRLGYQDQVTKFDAALKTRVNEHADLARAITLMRQNVIAHTNYRLQDSGDTLYQLGWGSDSEPHSEA